MQAYQLQEYTGPDGLTLVEIDAPRPDRDQVVLDVHAVGINFPDLLMTRGQYQLKPALPVVPGCEIAGTIVSAPEGCGWRTGEQAAAFVWQGGYAEQAVVPVTSLVHVPQNVELESAAAMMVNYYTVHFGLNRRGRVDAGDSVLVMGAGGGIGSAAVQVAIGLGATVIAGVASTEQIAVAEAAGATKVIVLDQGFATQVRELTGGRGVDAVLDPLGDWLFDEAVRALAPEGRVLVVGFAAGGIPQIKVNRLLLRNAGVLGVAWGAFLDVEPEILAEQTRSLDRMVAAGVVRPLIGARFSFAELPEALRQLGEGTIPGKAVVTVNSR